jgi:malate dehydrogenase (quinone)
MKSVVNHMDYDLVLIGGGVMSLSVAVMLQRIDPNIKMCLLERMNEVAQESSNAWNNAGTGHSAYCELNYTPEDAQGNVNISKAITIAEQFAVSKQWWSYLIEEGVIDQPVKTFLNKSPHHAFCYGDKDAKFLHTRWSEMTKQPIFKDMTYTEDRNVLEEWVPIMMEGRPEDQRVALTKMERAADLNFGALTKHLMAAYLRNGGDVKFEVDVSGLAPTLSRFGPVVSDGWQVSYESRGQLIRDPQNPLFAADTQKLTAKKVFVGAGGMSLRILQAAKMREIDGYGGFPVSGKFLVTRNPDLCKKHWSKVYGKAAVGAPPMSVPHLDSRTIDGEHVVVFGPYAGFSPNFLKHSGPTDLFASMNPFNLVPMSAAGAQNLDLTVYLGKELTKTQKEREDELRAFLPHVDINDWELITAGQRVQIMKPHPTKVGVLQLGTEVVASEDGSLSGLLGASPGASVSVSIATEVIEKMYRKEMDWGWRGKIQKMIPSYGVSLNDDAAFCKEIEDATAKVLKIDWTDVEDASEPLPLEQVPSERSSDAGVDEPDDRMYKLQSNNA